MTDTSAIDAASRRLSLALDALEAAADRRHDADRNQEALVEQIHTLGADRSRLAAELDIVAARAKALQTTNREIARRLDVAIETIRGVLESNDR
jgi:chromosome segregation ATPase